MSTRSPAAALRCISSCEEAQRGASVDHGPNGGAPLGTGRARLRLVFGDQHCARAHHIRSRDRPDRAGQPASRIRWVEINDVKSPILRLQHRDRFGEFANDDARHRVPGVDELDVAPEMDGYRAILFDERHAGSAPAQRLDPDGPGASAGVQKHRAEHTFSEDIVERFAHLVGGGADKFPGRHVKFASPERSADHPQLSCIALPGSHDHRRHSTTPPVCGKPTSGALIRPIGSDMMLSPSQCLIAAATSYPTCSTFPVGLVVASSDIGRPGVLFVSTRLVSTHLVSILHRSATLQAPGGVMTRREPETKVDLPVDKEKWHPSLLAGPIVLISTRSNLGDPHAASKSWLTMVCSRPPMLAFCCKLSHRTAINVLETREWVMNIPGEELAPRVWAAGDSVSAAAAEGPEVGGWTWAQSSVISAPRIQECRAHIECVLDSTKRFNADEMICLLYTSDAA